MFIAQVSLSVSLLSPLFLEDFLHFLQLSVYAKSLTLFKKFPFSFKFVTHSKLPLKVGKSVKKVFFGDTFRSNSQTIG